MKGGSIFVATAACLAALPVVFHSSGALNFLSFMMIVALAAQGWNILGGYAGQFSFGHAAFFGVGAYAMALLQARFGVNAWLAFPIAIACGALVGLVIGALAFRANLRGSYFALVTLAFAEVFRILSNAWSFTGAAAGVLLPLKPAPANFQFDDKRLFYWIAMGCVLAALALTLALQRSRLGAYFVAVRENEEAARALGVDALRVKLAAIALSGAVTAAAGCLYTQKFLYLDANIAFGPWISIEALLAPIVGGAGTALGPVVGAALLMGLGEVAKDATSALIGDAIPGVDLALFGVILILSVAFAPKGVMGAFASFGARFARRRS